jgi:hypothetical protein
VRQISGVFFFSGRGYVSEIRNIVILISNTVCFSLFLKMTKIKKSRMS